MGNGKIESEEQLLGLVESGRLEELRAQGVSEVLVASESVREAVRDCLAGLDLKNDPAGDVPYVMRTFGVGKKK